MVVRRTRMLPRKNGKQEMRSLGDRWTTALWLGPSLEHQSDGPETAELVREANLRWIQENGIESIETNVIYVIAKKDGG